MLIRVGLPSSSDASSPERDAALSALVSCMSAAQLRFGDLCWQGGASPIRRLSGLHTQPLIDGEELLGARDLLALGESRELVLDGRAVAVTHDHVEGSLHRSYSRAL